METDQTRIMIVEDEPRYLRVLKLNLEESNYEIIPAQNGAEALNLFIEKNPDLILLDLMMPGMDGYEVCRRIREFSEVPIIMLTALNETGDKVKGLDIGADDYITKPFSARELLARVRAALRRGQIADHTKYEGMFQFGDIEVDLGGHLVRIKNQEVKLTRTEYRLLCELVTHVNRVMVPEYLLEKVWGAGHEGETQLVWQAIHRLRQKIETDPQHPVYIQTHAGIGYIFNTNDDTH
ncbi:MAG: response regulator transcription factor [Anaerolineae bacterium]|nr:response regulator transcription factor [Anaerolineae bacterium]